MKVLFRGLCLEGPTFKLTSLSKTTYRHTEKAAEEIKAAAAAEYSHRAVRPLLVADKVVGGEHHLADVTVKTGFMPVLKEEKQYFHVIFTYIMVQRLKS